MLIKLFESWGGGGAGGLFSFQRPAQVQEVGGHATRGSKTNPNFQHVNKPSRISPNEVD